MQETGRQQTAQTDALVKAKDAEIAVLQQALAAARAETRGGSAVPERAATPPV